jgi:hypothetical protein
VAAVSSWHVDGRIRQRATRLLGDRGGPLRAAALAVRTLDFVPQVRDQALRGLLPHLAADVAEPVLGVLLAGRQRQHAEIALAMVLGALQERMSLADLVVPLLTSPQLVVRRWAYQTGHEYRLLSPEQLRSAVRSERDQLVRARCARWLAETGDPVALPDLLATRFVQARLDALTLISDDDLDQNTLLPLLADRAPRVRETARWRAGRRGVDVADWYRQQLSFAGGTPSFAAACLEGLASVGVAGDVQIAEAALNAGSPAVRTAAVTAVAALAHPSRPSPFSNGCSLTLLRGCPAPPRAPWRGPAQVPPTPRMRGLRSSRRVGQRRGCSAAPVAAGTASKPTFAPQQTQTPALRRPAQPGSTVG